MPYKEREVQLAAQANHYQKNKAKYQERNRKRKWAMRDWLREYKTGLKCECGEDRPAALTFHPMRAGSPYAEGTTNLCRRVSEANETNRLIASLG
jgi:hypothetical protein